MKRVFVVESFGFCGKAPEPEISPPAPRPLPQTCEEYITRAAGQTRAQSRKQNQKTLVGALPPGLVFSGLCLTPSGGRVGLRLELAWLDRAETRRVEAGRSFGRLVVDNTTRARTNGK